MTHGIRTARFVACFRTLPPWQGPCPGCPSNLRSLVVPHLQSGRAFDCAAGAANQRVRPPPEVQVNDVLDVGVRVVGAASPIATFPSSSSCVCTEAKGVVQDGRSVLPWFLSGADRALMERRMT